jgi:hypothetical protein
VSASVLLISNENTSLAAIIVKGMSLPRDCASAKYGNVGQHVAVSLLLPATYPWPKLFYQYPADRQSTLHDRQFGPIYLVINWLFQQNIFGSDRDPDRDLMTYLNHHLSDNTSSSPGINLSDHAIRGKFS